MVEGPGGCRVLPLRPEVGLDLLLVGDFGGVQSLVNLTDDHLLLGRRQGLPFSLDLSNHFVWAFMRLPSDLPTKLFAAFTI